MNHTLLVQIIDSGGLWGVREGGRRGRVRKRRGKGGREEREGEWEEKKEREGGRK